MNFGPLAEFERDLMLIEDVLADACDVLPAVLAMEITPRSLDRFERARVQANDLDEKLRKMRVAMHNLHLSVLKERRT